MSKYFNFWNMAYKNKWVSDAQILLAKTKGIITEEEYQNIIGGN